MENFPTFDKFRTEEKSVKEAHGPEELGPEGKKFVAEVAKTVEKYYGDVERYEIVVGLKLVVDALNSKDSRIMAVKNLQKLI